MAVSTDIGKKKEYCDEVLGELAFMIQNIHDLKAHAAETLGADTDLAKAHERHLTEAADYLDWKLQILTTACPFEWKGLGDGVEDVVSVRQPDVTVPEFSGGYVGG
jgi:hypothetical protein